MMKKITAFISVLVISLTLFSVSVSAKRYDEGKVFVSDNERAVVGSVNLDYRSLYWHYECAAYLYRTPAIADIYKDFVDTQKVCEAVTPETIKKIGIFSKIAAYILKIVAPLM